MEYLVTGMESYNNLYGLKDVITIVYWRDADGVEGETAILPPDPDNFTAFDDVTPEMMQQWIVNLNT